MLFEEETVIFLKEIDAVMARRNYAAATKGKMKTSMEELSKFKDILNVKVFPYKDECVHDIRGGSKKI